MFQSFCNCPECNMKRLINSMPFIDEAEARRRNAQAEIERAEREYLRTHWPCGKLRDN